MVATKSASKAGPQPLTAVNGRQTRGGGRSSVSANSSYQQKRQAAIQKQIEQAKKRNAERAKNTEDADEAVTMQDDKKKMSKDDLMAIMRENFNSEEIAALLNSTPGENVVNDYASVGHASAKRHQPDIDITSSDEDENIGNKKQSPPALKRTKTTKNNDDDSDDDDDDDDNNNEQATKTGAPSGHDKAASSKIGVSNAASPNVPPPVTTVVDTQNPPQQQTKTSNVSQLLKTAPVMCNNAASSNINVSNHADMNAPPPVTTVVYTQNPREQPAHNNDNNDSLTFNSSRSSASTRGEATTASAAAGIPLYSVTTTAEFTVFVGDPIWGLIKYPSTQSDLFDGSAFSQKLIEMAHKEVPDLVAKAGGGEAFWAQAKSQITRKIGVKRGNCINRIKKQFVFRFKMNQAQDHQIDTPDGKYAMDNYGRFPTLEELLEMRKNTQEYILFLRKLCIITCGSAKMNNVLSQPHPDIGKALTNNSEAWTLLIVEDGYDHWVHQAKKQFWDEMMAIGVASQEDVPNMDRTAPPFRYSDSGNGRAMSEQGKDRLDELQQAVKKNRKEMGAEFTNAIRSHMRGVPQVTAGVGAVERVRVRDWE